MSTSRPEQEPLHEPISVAIESSHEAIVESLAWSDCRDVLIMDEDNLLSPLNGVRMQISGSKQPFGSFNISAVFDYDKNNSDLVQRTIENLALKQYEGHLKEDVVGQFIFRPTDSKTQFFLYFDAPHNRFEVQTISNNDEPDNTLVLTQPRHGHDVFTDVMDNTLALVQKIVRNLYENVGHFGHHESLRIAIDNSDILELAGVEIEFIPETTPYPLFEDIAGMHAEKAQLQQFIDMYNAPNTFAAWGVQPSTGVLIHGEPGNGKTMLVRAMANELGAELISVESEAIYGKFVGDSERNMANYFDLARNAEGPVVLLFDELDLMIRPKGSDTLASVSSVFKKHAESLTRQHPHVVLAATINDITKVEKSLVRSGRFDVKIPVNNPSIREIEELLSFTIRSYDARASEDVQVFDLSVFDDINALAREADGLSRAQITTTIDSLVRSRVFIQIQTGEVPPSITMNDVLQYIRNA
jgi:ATP-dependent Zn protease